VPAIGPEDAVVMLEEGALMVDVREAVEWENTHIDGAILKPMSTIQEWWQDLPRDVDLIMQCRTGSRSAQVTDALIHQGGFDRVFNLEGGIIAWHSAGLPIERGSSTS
ncbi:MAG: rhodanese-like domain-containing protein, partial [Dehalococcoidia bacterium]